LPENSIFRKYFGETTTIYRKGNPFDWERTWGVWILALIICCIYEYKLFEEEKSNNK